jgi:hypothetical protein
MPAAVKLYAVPEFSGNPVSQKTFFNGDKVTFKWNNPGSSLILLAQTDVDKSNKSYYGETTMHILSANGGFDSRIQLGKLWNHQDCSRNANNCMQTRKAPSTMSPGHRMGKSLELYMVTCPRRPQSSMREPSRPTRSPWGPETRSFSHRMVASS